MFVARALRAVGVGTAMAGAVVFAGPAVAAADPSNGAAEHCRIADESGALDASGITRGECVNWERPSSENANNHFAGLCGFDSQLEKTGTTNKGQCIQVLMDLTVD
jgi:hypothetical protein